MMHMDNSKSTRVTVTLPEPDYSEIAKMAETNGVSISWVIRSAVHKFLAERAPLFADEELVRGQ